jgi:peptidoglycan/xylan/chitin deacetylase (PgdA/CDA1 family)
LNRNFPDFPRPSHAQARPITLSIFKQVGCQESRNRRLPKKSGFYLDQDIDIVTQSGGTALRYIRPLLDTAKVWHTHKKFMLIVRFLLFCLFASLGTAAQADDAAAPQTGEKSKPVVTAEPRTTFDWVHVDGPYIAMTFDDGPSAKLTPKLLDLLAAHHIKATFFLIGENAAEHPEIVAREAREGHEVANHSWSHPNLAKMSDDGIRSQLRKTDDVIRSAIGSRPSLLRPPYGSITARQKKWINQEFGYKIVLWDVDPLDWRRPGPNVVCNRIVKMARAGSIILAHDIHPGTIDAMSCVLDQLEAKGFKFVTVSELIAMETPVPPKPSPSPKASGTKSATPSVTPHD